jgi:hypothetical protein
LAIRCATRNDREHQAYPVVGTANWLLYTCYASKNQEKTLAGVFKYITNEAINFDPKKGILASAGLSPLSKAWRTAIEEAFITNKDKLGLQIEPVGGAGTCSQSGIIGG